MRSSVSKSAFDLKGSFPVQGYKPLIKNLVGVLVNHKLIKLQVVRRRALRGRSMARRRELLLENAKQWIKVKEERTRQKEVEDLHPPRPPGEGYECTRSLFWEMEELENQPLRLVAKIPNIIIYFAALTLQFVSHSFSEYHDPTIEDAYQQQAVIDGEAALLDILDTAGQIEFNAMRDQYMRCGEGFIICYSVTDRHSFQEAVEYKKLINKVRASEDIPLILIGNKCDLQHQRKVTMEEGTALAQQFGCPFFETSAALRHFVDDAFHTLIREIRAKEKGRHSGDKHHSSKWKRLRSILSVIFKKKSHYSF
ncbi:hypothetical protein RUM43_014620 [Polyplax serrata]|uniref:small monomeric GTPase n=1 Tax=Polyplax serrata TaxID=468196 RepID=A0AAN8NZ18_POLSC